jgi:hypothetical protein
MATTDQLAAFAAAGDASSVRRVLSAGVDPNGAVTPGRDDPLSAAAKAGHTEIAASLLRARARVTAKHFVVAAHAGSSQMIRLLSGLPEGEALPSLVGSPSPTHAVGCEGAGEAPGEIAEGYIKEVTAPWHGPLFPAASVPVRMDPAGPRCVPPIDSLVRAHGV